MQLLTYMKQVLPMYMLKRRHIVSRNQNKKTKPRADHPFLEKQGTFEHEGEEWDPVGKLLKDDLWDFDSSVNTAPGSLEWGGGGEDSRPATSYFSVSSISGGSRRSSRRLF